MDVTLHDIIEQAVEILDEHQAWLTPYAERSFEETTFQHPVTGRAANWRTDYIDEEQFAFRLAALLVDLVNEVRGTGYDIPAPSE